MCIHVDKSTGHAQISLRPEKWDMELQQLELPCLDQVLRNGTEIAQSPVCRGTVMFSRQSIFTTALPPLSNCLTIGPSKDSFSIRSLTSWEGEQVLGQSQEH